MKHKFVEFIPAQIEENTLYISIEYDVAKHKCACGCGDEIVTSLSPSRWKLIYDGESVSLIPSIGNWTHKCQSHYFITDDQVIWVKKFSQRMINEAIKKDEDDLKNHVRKGTRKRNFVEKLLRKLHIK